MRTREQEAAQLYAFALWVGAALSVAPVAGRPSGQHWGQPPSDLGVSQEQWDALVDAEVAPFVGGRVYVQGDTLVPESVALAGGAR